MGGESIHSSLISGDVVLFSRRITMHIWLVAWNINFI